MSAPAAGPGFAEEPPTDFCGHCGGPAGAGQHADCARALALEPPRYCTRCRRRMVVQVTPHGWTGRCAEHGRIAG